MVFKSFIQGWRRVNTFKKMWLFIFFVNVLIALTLTIPLQKDLQNSFGDSVVEDNMREGFDYWWYRHYQFEGKGLSGIFFAFVGGWGAVMENLQILIDADISYHHYSIMALGIIYLLLNMFFVGGIIGIYNGEEKKFSLAEFFAQSGRYFWRFLRLFAISLLFYGFLVYMLKSKLSMKAYSATADNTTEWPGFLMRLGINLLAVFLLCLVNMIFDYAKISTVAQQGKSMLRQVVRAIIFVFKNFWKTLRLYYLIILVGVVLVVIYALIEPQFDQSVLWSLIVFFLIQQLFILGKIWIKLTFYASQLELFRTVAKSKSS